MFVGSSGRIDMIAAYRDHPIPPQTIGKVVFYFATNRASLTSNATGKVNNHSPTFFLVHIVIFHKFYPSHFSTSTRASKNDIP